MDRHVLEPPARWATVVNVVMLATSLIVIAQPELRIMAVRLVLTVLVLAAWAESLCRLRRAGGLHTPVQALAPHLPSSPSFTESLARIALLVTSLTVVLAF